MVDDQVIDVSGVHQLLDMVHQFTHVGFLDRIEESDFFVLDQEGIIGCSFIRGVAMEIPDIPVNGTYPEDVLFNFRGVHIFSLCNIYSPGLVEPAEKLDIEFNAALKSIGAE